MAVQPLITAADIQVFDEALATEKADMMIKHVMADAVRIAPQIATSTDPLVREQAASVILRAVLRWNDSGSGALQQWSNSDGPFSRSATVDTRGSSSHGYFYPSEENRLKEIFAPKAQRRSGSRWLL